MDAIAYSIGRDRPTANINVVTAERPEKQMINLPLKPTARMLAAGAWEGGVTVGTVWEIYVAMLRSVE